MSSADADPELSAMLSETLSALVQDEQKAVASQPTSSKAPPNVTNSSHTTPCSQNGSKQTQGKTKSKRKSSNQQASGSSKSNAEQSPEELEAMMAQLEGEMREMMSGDPELAKQFEELSAATDPSNAAGAEFALSVEEMVSRLRQSADGESGGAADEEAFSKLFGAFQQGGGGDPAATGVDGLPPFFMGFFRQIISKDVLYPPMRQLADAYPSWLSEKQVLLAPEEHENYASQLPIIEKICIIYESEQGADGEEQFGVLVTLLQQLQALGEPPKDLLESVGGGDAILNPFGMLSGNGPPAGDSECKMQ